MISKENQNRIKKESDYYGINKLSKDSGVSKHILYKIFRGDNVEMASMNRVLETLKIKILIP